MNCVKRTSKKQQITMKTISEPETGASGVMREKKNQTSEARIIVTIAVTNELFIMALGSQSGRATLQLVM